MRMLVREAQGVLPGVEEVIEDGLHPRAVFDRGEDKGAVAPHATRVAIHHLKIGAHLGGEVDLVDDQEIRLGDAGSALARNLITAGDVDDLDGEVCEFPAETSSQVVPAGFEQQEVGMKLRVEFLEGEEVGGDVFTDGGMGAAAGFHGADAFGGQGLVTDEKLAVFAGEDVVGDCGEIQAGAQVPTELQHERGFAAADGSPDSHGEGALGEVAIERSVAQVEVPGMLQVFVGVRMGMPMRMPMSVPVSVIMTVIMTGGCAWVRRVRERGGGVWGRVHGKGSGQVWNSRASRRSWVPCHRSIIGAVWARSSRVNGMAWVAS